MFFRYRIFEYLATSKLNSKEALISEVSIDSVFAHHDFLVRNNLLKEYNKMKEEMTNLKA